MGVYQPPLQERQAGAAGHEDAHVRIAHGTVGFISVAVGSRLVQGFPLLGDHLPYEEADLPRFLPSNFSCASVDGFVAERPHSGAVGVSRVANPEGGHGVIPGLGVLASVPVGTGFLHPLLKQSVDPADDGFLRAKILHQLQGSAAGLFHARLQALHLADVGAAEPIDGLLGIADHEEFARFRVDLIPPGQAVRSGAFGTGRRGQQHGDFGLDRVSVLGLVDQQVGVTVAEVVADVRVVPQQVTGPHQQILELCTTLGATLVRVSQCELSQILQDGHEGRAAGALDILIGLLIQFIEDVLQGSAGVFAGVRIGTPVSLATLPLTQRQQVEQDAAVVGQAGRSDRPAAERSQPVLDMVVQRVARAVL